MHNTLFTIAVGDVGLVVLLLIAIEALDVQPFAPVDGSYAVIVTNGACSDTSECLTVDRIFVGLNEDITESNVSVYPNPSTNRFLLQTDGTGHMVIEVTDMIGRIVYSKNITANGNLIQVIDLGNETA